ncbi:MAG: cell division protein [Stappia sp.]|mgnify:CR=1 FL=1|uniref:peptidoglycan D,D-transpeptidase FtsI family protein n=1 Tax=Stappia sp. TaxID=1870903 RepID=UPI000C619095|nr:penicillin-binding protein 2 [Stappia sp.]MAA97983.1 cell division protein [Stappia sp.]MBM22394.1 cell division protein [Stappia sp.]
MAITEQPVSFLQRRAVGERRIPRAPSSRATRARVHMAMVMFTLVFVAIASRLVMLGMSEEARSASYISAQDSVAAARPNLVDRNGQILATDIKTASLYAEPRKIIDVDEALEGIASVLPELGTDRVRARLASNAGFIWLKRELTPRQRNRLHDLGIPGIGFLEENSRFYPGGPTASHIVGSVNVDNQGISGMELSVDRAWLGDLQKLGLTSNRSMEPVALSIDLRAQHVVRDELAKAMERYKAIAAMGIVLDVETGEVIAMSSLPDFDPNDRSQALDPNRMNRASGGVYEMGSVFKGFTVAMALDSGKVTMDDMFDATRPIRIGGRTINDFHGKHRPLSVAETFIYSSNIGTAKMMLSAGIDHQQAFLKKVGLTTRLDTELPEVATPLLPPKWNELAAITISFGHGISVTPLQTAVAAAALVNGGELVPPTFLPRTAEEAASLKKRVVSEHTSAIMRYLFRLNVLQGSGRRAKVPGYLVGGKTGTAEKIEGGRYVSNKRRNSFLSAFPMDKPKYVVLVVIDEPKPEREGIGATAGLNAAPTVSGIIGRIAPMLGVLPKFGDKTETISISY